MRTDTASFAAKNTALAKRPRYVIELAFDSLNTILWYFTSHTDSALPPGASSILGVIEGMAGTSQTLNPDTANASIGNINFMVVDKASIVTTTLGSQLVLGRSTRRQRVRVYVGYEGLPWADYTLVQTQLVTEIAYVEGAYKFTCADVQREMRKDIFELAKTTLAQSLSEGGATVEVFNTAAFQTVTHGNSFSDAPSSTVGYIKIQDEVIRWTGKTSTQFTGCTRGALNTRPVEHAIDAATAADQRTSVEEYVYLEMPAVDLMYRLLTGKDRLGNSAIPTAWNLGIPTSYVRLADFTGIGKDLWDTSDDSKGFTVRFDGITKTDGKKFIESELALLSGLFMPIYADGAIGLRRMSNILAGSSYVKMLDDSNLVDVGDLVHDFDSLHNVLQISWNWEPSQKDFTRVNLLIDAGSVSSHGRSDPLKLKFRGLNGSIHSSTILAQRFDALRDRYSGPPLRTDVTVVPSLNTLEVGDIVRLKPPGVRDFVANGSLDRSFEIQNVGIDWVTGKLGVKLFASSQAPGAIPPTSDATVLPDAWYSSQGTALSTLVTITGSNPGHVTVGGTLTGTADMNAAGSIFYYPGDLVIDPGVTINVVNNVQLRVKGFFQNNGTINGRGNGLAGVVAVVTSTTAYDYNAGTAGFIGSTEAGGGVLIQSTYQSLRGGSVQGANSTMPSFVLDWDGATLLGLPTSLLGSSGSSGGPVSTLTEIPPIYDTRIFIPGGAGGSGGAGLIIVSRGLALGASAIIDLSGGAGSNGSDLGAPYFDNASDKIHAGSGAGGAPGGLLVVLDGSGTNATGLTVAGFVAQNGSTPIRPVPFEDAAGPGGSAFSQSRLTQHDWYSFFVGTGDGTTFSVPSLSGARGGNRVQYVPGNVAATADLSATLAAPTNLGLASGTNQLLVQGDGTIVPRILATWTPSLDSRTLGYDLQFKPSTQSLWGSAPTIFGQAVNAAFISGIADGINYDVRIRSAGADRAVSDWLTITGYFVTGKTELPSDVNNFTIEGTRLSWTPVTDVDVVSGGGYRIKYQPGTSHSWGDALALHTGILTNSPFDMQIIPSGPVTIMIKAVDSSGNESQNPASVGVNLGELFIANVVQTFDRKAAGFPGVKTACSVSGGNLVADAITPLAWNANDQVSAWNADPSVLAWSVVQYATMTYVDTVTVTQALAGSRLTIQKTISGDPWSLEYRENSAALAWSPDSSTLAWNANSATLAWDSPSWLPWPGEIIVKNSVYDIRIIAGQSNTQGMVTQLTLTVDAPDISEFLPNVAISAAGTRLPITKSYVFIKGVNLTLVADGGTAVRPQQEDALSTGPLVKTYDATPTAVTGHVNARIEGY